MASTNQSPAYIKAHGKFLAAATDKERLEALEEMIKECPKHKSSEKMLANLKTRYKKLKAQLNKTKKAGKSTFKGIKKEDMQAVIVGFTNSGKSSLLSLLTHAQPQIADYKFTTKQPVVGVMDFAETQIQLIEIPAIESEYYGRGLANTADTILILITNLEQIKQIKQELFKSHGKQIIIFNKSDLLTENEKRKISATLQSKKYNFVIISAKTKENINELKNKIFQSFPIIRVFTKEPGKSKTSKPMILKPESTIKDVAEKILKGFSSKIKETKIWGPSSKFPGQKVGLNHKLKDLDTVEFKTK